MRRFWPIGVLIVFFVILYKDFFFHGLIPVPTDTLVGAYYPWLDYKWGYVVGVPVKNALISDVFSYFFTIKHISIDILKQGVIPYWNPSSFSGTPLLATFHSTTLAPWNLFFLLSKYTGWGMYIFGSSLFAACSMYLYLVTIVKGRIARLVGAIVFSLAGPMTTWAEFGTAVWAAGCIPLIFLGLEMALSHHRLKYYFLVVAATVLLVLSGHVQLLTYTFIIAPLFVLFKTKKISQTIIMTALLILGLLLTSIQLIPTYDFFSRSIRSEEKYSQTFHSGLIPPAQLIRLWVPDFFGHPSTGNSWGPYIYHEYASFLGTIILPLIIAALFYRRSFTVQFFSGVFVLSLVMVLDQPLSRWLFSLPLPLFTYSSASRLFFITGLSGSVLAAAFLDNPRWRRVILPTLVLLIISGLSAVFVPASFKNTSLRNLIFPIVQLGLLLIFILISNVRRFLPLLLLLIIIFDFSRYFVKYNPFVPTRLVFPATPIIDFLTSQTPPFRIAREPAALLPPNTWSMYGLENIEGYDPLYLSSYSHFFHIVNNQPYSDSASRFSDLTDFNPRFLDALNVKYLITLTPKSPNQPSAFMSRVNLNSYPLVFSDGHVRVYQNTSALPRAYFVPHLQTVNSETELAKILEQSVFDPTTTAVILSPQLTSSGSVGLISDFSQKPNSVTLTASATSSGILVLADSYDPGWTAVIDGRSTPVYRANGALQAIIFPGGTHQVIFRYLPPYMGYALLLTTLAWLGVSIGYFVFTRKIV